MLRPSSLCAQSAWPIVLKAFVAGENLVKTEKPPLNATLCVLCLPAAAPVVTAAAAAAAALSLLFLRGNQPLNEMMATVAAAAAAAACALNHSGCS